MKVRNGSKFYYKKWVRCDTMQQIVSRFEALDLEESQRTMEESQRTIREIALAFESFSFESGLESGLVQDAERGPPPNRKEHLFQQCRENVLKLCRENRQLRKEIQLIQMYVRHVLECAPIPQNRRPQWVR